MDARVSATIALHLAKSELKAAELEALEKETPNLRSNSNQRIVIARKLKAARELAQSWSRVLGLVAGEKTDQMVCELKAPKRVVGWCSPNGALVCNRPLCKEGHGDLPKGWTAVRANETTMASYCDRCGTDVLA